MFATKAVALSLCACLLSAEMAIGQAQAWAWAVYHNGRGTIFVARMSTVSPTSEWVPLAPYTNQSYRQAQDAACLLSTIGDLRNRRYRTPQIERGEWIC